MLFFPFVTGMFYPLIEASEVVCVKRRFFVALNGALAETTRWRSPPAAAAAASPRVDVEETSQQLSAAADDRQKGSILIRDPESFQVFVHIAGSGTRVLWVTPRTTLSDLCGTAGLDRVENGCDVYATVGTRLLGWDQSVHSCGVVAGSRVELLEVNDSDFSVNSGDVAAARAIAGVSDGNLGLRQMIESQSRLNSSMGVACVGSAFAAVAPLGAAVSPTHVARNSLVVGGQGPTGRRSTKGGGSGPAEDLRPVSEVEAGVNFRTAGGARGQQVHFPEGNQSQVPGR